MTKSTEEHSASYPGTLNHGWVFRDRISPAAAGMTVLDFYVRFYPHSSLQEWQARLDRGQILVEGQAVRGQERLVAGQHLEYHRLPWCETPVPLDYRILHRDEHLLIVEKPSGLPTLPGGDFLEHTLLHQVRQREGGRWAPMHRLGRATSGIVLFAATSVARQRMAAAFREGGLRKIYRALVVGADIRTPQVVELPIGKLPYAPLGTVHAVTEAGRPSRSLVSLGERRTGPDQALVEVEIPTGRPHQIRIHLAGVGHPLAGDPLYAQGGVPIEPPAGRRPPLPGDGGYHLHAWRVLLRHPVTGVEMDVISPPPSILCKEGEAASVSGLADPMTKSLPGR